MDEVNINKYLGQFNPILIVPVLSAVFGAILVFVFGFKRPNEPRFQSSDSLKKSKRKANAVQSSTKQSTASSAKVSSAKKTGDASAAVVSKKGSGSEKPNSAGSGTSNTNNNNTSSNNNNINKKKTENGSPAKKVANKKTGKETAVTAPANKKSKAGKSNASDDKALNEKPADFDDGGWFTVQSKSGKQKNKGDDSAAANAVDANASPKAQQLKANNKSAKSAKSSTAAAATVVAPTVAPTAPADNASEIVVESSAVDQTSTIELSKEITIETPNVIAEPPAAAAPAAATINDDDDDIIETVEKEAATTVPAAVPAIPVVDSSSTIAFDEMGDWTDAKPDRKRGNKKKSRKD